jgi:hypothetical protein
MTQHEQWQLEGTAAELFQRYIVPLSHRSGRPTWLIGLHLVQGSGCLILLAAPVSSLDLQPSE